MQKPDATILLKQLILTKEIELFNEGKLLKAQFQKTYESLKPVNILKSTFKEIISKSGLKGKIIDSLVGFTSELAVKKLVVGNTDSSLKKIMGSFLEIVIAKMITKSVGKINLLVTQLPEIINKAGQNLKNS